jgi:hypothetical protein
MSELFPSTARESRGQEGVADTCLASLKTW